MKRSRVHPLAVLVAQKIYAQGHGDKGALKWSPVSAIVDALDAAFNNVEPCNKPVLLALDVSGSMACSMIAGSCVSAREASAAMALITAATEPEHEIIGVSAPTCGGYPKDEAPAAYKNFDAVLDSVQAAGLASEIARLKARFVIKDSDTSLKGAA